MLYQFLLSEVIRKQIKKSHLSSPKHVLLSRRIIVKYTNIRSIDVNLILDQHGSLLLKLNLIPIYYN